VHDRRCHDVAHHQVVQLHRAVGLVEQVG
jgi:hypothetical protein